MREYVFTPIDTSGPVFDSTIDIYPLQIILLELCASKKKLRKREGKINIEVGGRRRPLTKIGMSCPVLKTCIQLETNTMC